MQSINMQELNYYTLLFKGNYKKGVNILKNIMENPILADELVNSPIALGVIYNVDDKNSAELVNVMNGYSNYTNKIFITLLKTLGIDTGTYTTPTQLFTNNSTLSTILGNSKAQKYINKMTSISNTLFNTASVTKTIFTNDTLTNTVLNSTYYKDKVIVTTDMLDVLTTDSNKLSKALRNNIINQLSSKMSATHIDNMINSTDMLNVLGGNTTILNALTGMASFMEKVSLNVSTIHYLCTKSSTNFKKYIENSSHLTTYYDNFYNTMLNDTTKFTLQIDKHTTAESWTDSTYYVNGTVTAKTTTVLTADNSIFLLNSMYAEGNSESYTAKVYGLSTNKSVTEYSSSYVTKKKVLFGGAKMTPASTSSSYDAMGIYYALFVPVV